MGKGSSFIISLSCLDDEFCRLDFKNDMIFEDGREHFDENTSIAEKGDFRSLRFFFLVGRVFFFFYALQLVFVVSIKRMI